MTMKSVILFFLLSMTVPILAQNYRFFSILPDIGAAKNQSRFKAVIADSQNIYVFGDMVSSLDSNGNNKSVSLCLSKFNYQGDFKGLNIIDDSTLTRPYISNNYPFYKLNDSISYYLVRSRRDPSKFMYNSNTLCRINICSGKLEDYIYLPFSLENDMIVDSYVTSKFKNGRLSLVINLQAKNIIHSNYIMDINPEMDSINLIKLPGIPDTRDYYRWVSTDDHITYELIGEAQDYNGNQVLPTAKLFYLKVDSSGKVLKRENLKLEGNFYIGTGQTFTIHRNTDKTFAMAINEVIKDVNIYSIVPHMVKVSPEFDSVHWLINYSEFPKFTLEPDYFIYYMTVMKDSSYVVSFSTLYNNADLGQYGNLFKANNKGDSLWQRKYQPLSWDFTRPRWMFFSQVECTPYNTLAVTAFVNDRVDNITKGWLLHLDSDGCLVPNCGHIVNVEDIKLGKDKAFHMYPNPVVNDRINILSHVSEKDDSRIELMTIDGRLIKSTKFRPLEQMQYFLELDSDIPSGNYILKIHGNDYSQVEKINISR